MCPMNSVGVLSVPRPHVRTPGLPSARTHVGSAAVALRPAIARAVAPSMDVPSLPTGSSGAVRSPGPSSPTTPGLRFLEVAGVSDELPYRFTRSVAAAVRGMAADQEATTTVEYALLLALIAVSALAAFQALGRLVADEAAGAVRGLGTMTESGRLGSETVPVSPMQS